MEPSQTYPCPECIQTIFVGAPRIHDEHGRVLRGTGKLYYPYSGAAVAGPTPGRMDTCWRCKGSGVVEERRRAPERRKGGDRRG